MVEFAPELAPELEFLLLKSPSAPRRLSHAVNVTEVVVGAAANSPATMWWLPRIVDLSRVDLFHATFNILPAGLAMPCVTTVHDIMWLTRQEWCNARLSRPLERRFYRHGIARALRNSAAVATVSEASRSEIATHFPDVISRLRVTSPGVGPAYTPGQVTKEQLAGLGIPEGRKVVLTVGQYVPYKNHEGALRIFAKAFAGRDDVVMVFVQRLSRNAERLRAQARHLGIADRVHFLGALDDDELTAFYRSASVLLHPSFCEGFGLPLAEAMACGCPVVASDCSAMPEVLGDAGMLAPVNDEGALAQALRRVVDDAVLARRLGRAGMARAANMRWREFARANVDIYREVLRNAQRSSEFARP